MEWLPTIAPVGMIALAFFAGWRYLDSRFAKVDAKFATFDNRLTKLETQMDLLLRGLHIQVSPKSEGGAE